MEDEAQVTSDPKLLALTKDPMTRLALLFFKSKLYLGRDRSNLKAHSEVWKKILVIGEKQVLIFVEEERRIKIVINKHGSNYSNLNHGILLFKSVAFSQKYLSFKIWLPSRYQQLGRPPIELASQAPFNSSVAENEV